MLNVNDMLSINLQFKTTVFLGIPRDFTVFHNSIGLPTISKSFLVKNACFLAVINVFALYLAFLHNSLSMCSLAFLNALKTVPLVL